MLTTIKINNEKNNEIVGRKYYICAQEISAFTLGNEIKELVKSRTRKLEEYLLEFHLFTVAFGSKELSFFIQGKNVFKKTKTKKQHNSSNDQRSISPTPDKRFGPLNF